MKPTSCSIAEFAAIVGRDRKTISKWIKAGLPASGAGVQGTKASINAPVAIEWLLARERYKFNPELGQKTLQPNACAYLANKPTGKR